MHQSRHHLLVIPINWKPIFFAPEYNLCQCLQGHHLLVTPIDWKPFRKLRDGELADVIAAILLSRFNGRSITDICAMGGITIDDFTNSVAYREIYGLGRQEGQREGRREGRLEGRQEGQQEGRRAEAAAMTQRLLQRRFGLLAPEQQALLQAMPLAGLEALADALLDFQTAANLTAWLAQHQF